MLPVIEPVDRALLIGELTPERKICDTLRASNEVYSFRGAEAPHLMREVGRLREEAYRASGGGTGSAVDIDEDDMAADGYEQLIVWDPAQREIVAGYRYIICNSPRPKHLSTEHYFRFSNLFRRKFLPKTLELGRAFVQVAYQARHSEKGIYAMDNMWEGLGGVIIRNPQVKYLFGKVTFYSTFKIEAKALLHYFLQRYSPKIAHLVQAHEQLSIPIDRQYCDELFCGGSYEENYKILVRTIRELGENIPPMINCYMHLSHSIRVLDTFINREFGDVEETGIIVAVNEIQPDKAVRYLKLSPAN